MSENRMPRSFNSTPKPFNFQSTQQSPSFMKAVKPPTGASTKSGNVKCFRSRRLASLFFYAWVIFTIEFRCGYIEAD